MARSLRVEIVGDARSLERSFARASKATRGFGGDMRQANRHVSRSQRAFGGLHRSVLGLAGGFVGVAGLTSAVHAAFSEMADAQKATAQTGAVLKSTSGIANVTAGHVDALATSLLNLSGTDDEVIKSGENMLLTFTNIRNEVGKGNDIFDQATKAVLDFSVSQGRDMRSSAILVGKALQDPVKGVTALQRVGVRLTDSQKDQVKALVASGHALEAQKLILRELNVEFAGSAAAAGRTLPGKLNILRETARNLAGSIAQLLTPSITKLVDSLVKWLSNSKNQKSVLDTVKAAASAVSTAVKVLTTAFQALNGITGSTKNTFKLLLGIFVAVKALQMAAAFSSMTTAIVGMQASLLGPAGLVVAVGALSFALTTVLLKVTGLDRKVRGVGAAAADLLGVGGGAGGPAPSQAQAGFIRGQARRLRASGLSAAQTAARLTQLHPGIAGHDIRVLSGGIVVHGGIHLHGVQNVKQLENELGKRRKQRPHARRGGRS